jgi:hypothetical protein
MPSRLAPDCTEDRPGLESTALLPFDLAGGKILITHVTLAQREAHVIEPVGRSTRADFSPRGLARCHKLMYSESFPTT